MSKIKVHALTGRMPESDTSYLLQKWSGASS